MYQKQLILLLFFLWMPIAFAMETISLRADEWCPYTCQSHSEKPGFLIEIAKVLFEKEGYSINYQIMPWSRAILETREGRYHAIVGAFKEDAPDFIFPENELALSVNTFFAKQGTTWKFKDLSSLESLSVGVIRDYSYGEHMDSYVEKYKKDSKKIQIVSGDNALELNIKKLLLGRIHVFLEDQLVVQHYLITHPQQGKLMEVGTMGKEPVYIAFSPHFPSSQQYAKILSNGIEELRINGKLREILARYGLKDWK